MQHRILKVLMLAVMVTGLTACASKDSSVGRFKVGKSYSVKGQTYYPEENYEFEETGLASWYGPGFNGKKTANGETFDEDALTAAHKTLQLPSLVRVTNLDNGRSIVVRVTDRGPFHSNRVIDLSKGAAKALDFIKTGTAKVKLQVLGPESMALAEAARRKIDTRGAEIAVNNTGRLDNRFAAFYPSEFGKAQPSDSVMLASNSDYMTSDAAIGQPRPPYVPQTPVEQAVAWNPQPQDLAPAAGTPYPPELPPQRQPDAREVAIARTRSAIGNTPYPEIPVSTLDTSDIAVNTVRPQIVPVAPSNIYVQAGSYTTAANAQRAVQQVSNMGPTKIISAKLGGQPYFRVRIGPMQSVEKADALVSALQRTGRQATIVVAD